MSSRANEKLNAPVDWATLARRSERRVDALLHAVTIARLGSGLDDDALRDIGIAEYESALYHRARADGKAHILALAESSQGRLAIDELLGKDRDADALR